MSGIGSFIREIDVKIHKFEESKIFLLSKTINARVLSVKERNRLVSWVKFIVFPVLVYIRTTIGLQWIKQMQVLALSRVSQRSTADFSNLSNLYDLTCCYCFYIDYSRQAQLIRCPRILHQWNTMRSSMKPALYQDFSHMLFLLIWKCISNHEIKQALKVLE